MKRTEDESLWNWRGCVGNEELKALARALFIDLDMVKAFDADYEVAIKVLRRVYNEGRTRSVYEKSSH